MRNKHRALAIGVALFLAAGIPTAGTALAAGATHEYQIAAGQLGASLNALAAQSHVQILYAPDLVQGKTAPAFAGNYSVDRALQRLLRGSGLHGEAVNGDTYVIRNGAARAPAAAPAPASTPQAPPQPATLKAVQVTGSLIPKAQIETASPTIQLTAQDMARRGFNTVYDALRQMPIATGPVQGPQGASTYTTGAQALSLFGLDPGFTLVMVDGHPLPDYPLLYDGASNFSDLSGIPIAMVERIDIVPGNQSAVYGSSAIAGVVNIVLKKHVQGLNLGVRYGGYTQGGGNNQRVELVGGHSWLDDRANLTYGFQYSDQEPIWAYDRDLTASTAANPTTPNPVGIRTFMHGAFGANGMALIAPPAGACDSLKSLFDGTTYLAQDASGQYCGSNAAGYRTMMNGQRQYVGYATGSFRLNDNAELYGSAQYTVAQYRFAPLGGFIWLPNLAGYGMFVDGGTGKLSTAWRQLAPEEQDYTASENMQSVHSYQTVFGVRGNFGNSNWAYDGYLDRAEQIVNERQLHPLLAKVDAFFENQFLGPQQGVDPATGYPIFTPDWSRFYQAITPADYRAFSDYTETRSSTSTQHATLLINNTDLFSLPAGSASLAAQVQAGHQTWNNPTDPRVVAGQFWGLSGTVGSGTRDSYSGAVELNVPITSTLTADAAVRYDEYKYAGRNDGKATWRVGLEFRPVDTLLFRGNYATAFRAPDMGRIFLGPSSTFLGVTDYYLCDTREPGVPLASCSYNNVQTGGVHAGNPNLKDITAKSWGAGVVWSPTSAFNLHADYLHINIADEITDLNVDTLMRDNAGCLEGRLPAGSPTCVDTLARVTRDSLGNIQNITFGPINISTERLESVTAGASYRLDTDSLGSFTFGAEYNNVLKHSQRRYPGDPEVDLLRDPTQSTEFKTITTANVNWAIHDWNFALYGVRYGRTPNFVARLAGYPAPNAGTLGAWTLFNASAAYQLSDSARLSLSVNNLFDKDPPRDNTYARWPYYNNQNYNIYGRAYYLQFDWAIGGR